MQRLNSSLAALLASAAMAGSTLAAGTLTVKRAPLSTNVTELKQRLVPLFAARDAAAATRMQQLEAAAQNAYRALAPERAVYARALNADPRYRAYLAQADAVTRGAGTPQQRAAALTNLTRANRAVFDDAVRATRLDLHAIQAKAGIGAITPDLSFRVALAGPLRSPLSIAPGTAVPAAQATSTLLQPYDFEDVNEDNQGLAYQAADGDANADNGKARSNSTIIGIAGQARAIARVGKVIDVPVGMKHVDVTLSVHGTYHTAAGAAVGYSSTCADFGVGLVDPLNSNSLDGDSEGECRIVAIGWFAEASGEATHDFRLAANIAAGTHQLLILADTYAEGNAGGAPGYADSDAHVELRKITARFSAD